MPPMKCMIASQFAYKIGNSLAEVSVPTIKSGKLIN